MMKQKFQVIFQKMQSQRLFVSAIPKLTFLLFLLIGTASTILAQKNDKAIKHEELLYIEADPLAYINKGYSIHLGYENWGWRFDITKVKVDFPESFEEAFYNTKAFDLITEINGIKVDYIGKRNNWTKNGFLGLDINYQNLSFEHRETGQSKNLNAFNIGVRAGYKIPIWKGLYITPWAAYWRNVHAKHEFIVDDDQISTNNHDWIVTFHIGYAIKL